MERILHVFKSLTSGGAQTMVMNVYRNIDRTKFQFDFIVCTNDKDFYSQEVLEYGGRIYTAPDYKVTEHFRYINWWNDFFTEHQEYNIIHGHLRSTASLYLSVAQKYGIKTISHSHSVSNGKGISAIIKKLYQHNISKYSDYMMACSQIAGEWLFGKKVIQQNNYRVIPNAIELCRYKNDIVIHNQAKRALGVENKHVIGNIGRFVDVKNHNFLIDIFNVVHSINKDSVLVLVGSGELENSIREKVHSLNLDEDVMFLGQRLDVPEVIKAFDLLVLPSKYEGLGIVAIEGQAAGITTIISDGFPDEVRLTDRISVINLTEDINCWASAITERLSNSFFEDYSNIALIEKGYDINYQVNIIADIYLSLLGGNIHDIQQ